MLHYFFVGMEQVFSYNIFINSTILIGFMLSVIIFRRWTITHQSGGSYFSSFKITDDYFYIHSGMVPGNRRFSLSDINNVIIHLIRGRGGNGDRFHIELDLKLRRNKAFFVGKSSRTVKEIEEMKTLLKKNKINVNYYNYT